MERICKKCGCSKTLDNEHFQFVKRDNYFSHTCKVCRNAKEAEYRLNYDPVKVKATRSRYTDKKRQLKPYKPLLVKKYSTDEERRQAKLEAKRKFNASPKGIAYNQAYRLEYAKKNGRAVKYSRLKNVPKFANKKEYKRWYDKFERDTLGLRYIKSRLINKTNLKFSDLTTEMIETKYKQLKLKRYAEKHSGKNIADSY